MRPFWKQFWLVDEIDQYNIFGIYVLLSILKYNSGKDTQEYNKKKKEGQLFSHYIQNWKIKKIKKNIYKKTHWTHLPGKWGIYIV